MAFALNWDESLRQDVRGILGLLVDSAANDQDAAAVADELAENIEALDAAALVAINDLGMSLVLIVNHYAGARGGIDALRAQAIVDGRATMSGGLDAQAST